MRGAIHVREYQRRRPERRPEYRAIHNRLYDEVMFLQDQERRMEEELAAQIEAEMERV